VAHSFISLKKISPMDLRRLFVNGGKRFNRTEALGDLLVGSGLKGAALHNMSKYEQLN